TTVVQYADILTSAAGSGASLNALTEAQNYDLVFAGSTGTGTSLNTAVVQRNPDGSKLACNAGANQFITSDQTATLSGSAGNGTAPYSYSWSGSGVAFSYPNGSDHSIAVATMASPGNYAVTLTCSDNSSAQATSVVTIAVSPFNSQGCTPDARDCAAP